MKTTTNWLVAATVAAFCCSIGNAQINYSSSLVGATLIYSNGFGGAAANINGTAPDFAVTVYGGSSTSLWLDVLGASDTNALFANGVQNTAQQNSWLLPFKAQPGLVYTLTASVHLYGNPGSWLGAGFAENYINAVAGHARLLDTGTAPLGVDWGIMTPASSAFEYWAGPDGGTIVFSESDFYGANADYGTHVMTFVLDTTTNHWIMNAFVDGIPALQSSTNYTYGSNPTIGAIGLTQTSQSLTARTNIVWTSFSLCYSPAVFGQQPESTNISAGVAFTNTVRVAATNGSSFRWYVNSVDAYAGAAPMTNTSDGRISGATNGSLVFTNVHAGDAGFYYVIVTNIIGANTSSIAPLVVYSSPVLLSQLPVTYTDLFTLYAGASPQFSITASGTQPIHYRWYENGVLLGGQTNDAITLTNVQVGTISTYCVATNSGGVTTSTVWSASVIADPTAPFPTNVLALKPIGYWPLNEAEVGGGDDGVVALDYAGGNDGTYTNAVLENTGYSGTDPGDFSAFFSGSDSGAFGIEGISFGAPTNTSATFTVQAWVNSPGGSVNGGGIVSEGYEGSEQFSLDIYNSDYRFLVNDASGNSYSAQADFGPDGNWHYLVGVCDEVNGAVTLYVDGAQASSAPIAPGSGLLASTNSMSIGARSSTPSANNDLQFDGYIDEVAAFNYALTYPQVVALAESVGLTLPPYFASPLPPTNVVVTVGTTLTIPATVSGSPPLGYYWTNLTTAAVLASGATSAVALVDAALSIPDVTTNWNGDELELVVTNALGSTNWFVSVAVIPPPTNAPYTSDVIYSNSFYGGAVGIAGTAPTVANILVGGTNALWTCTYTNGPGLSNATVLANGFLGTNAGSALLPFTPEPGFVYTMTATLVAPDAMHNWVAMGFAESAAQTANPGFARFTDAPVYGDAWMYVQNSTAVFEEDKAIGGVGSLGSVPLPSATPVTLQLILNTITNNGWTAAAFLNGSQIGTNIVFATTPPIAYAGLCQNQFALSDPTAIQWVTWELTGDGTNVPPYLLEPLPPTNITVAAGATLTIPATLFGSVPLGYSWRNTNTAAVLGSGATNSAIAGYLSPLNATLTVPDVPFGWNGNRLQLTTTNAYGTNTTLVALTVTVNTNRPPILYSAANGQLTLSWPTNLGWTLQAQTNSVTSNNWVNVANSTSTNQFVIPINPANGSVFYRLVLQP